jgi:hypothetical protein
MIFGYKIDIHGTWIITKKERLTTASLYEPDIDRQVQSLKDELDEIAMAMKHAIVQQCSGSLGLKRR